MAAWEEDVAIGSYGSNEEKRVWEVTVVSQQYACIGEGYFGGNMLHKCTTSTQLDDVPCGISGRLRLAAQLEKAAAWLPGYLLARAQYSRLHGSKLRRTPSDRRAKTCAMCDWSGASKSKDLLLKDTITPIVLDCGFQCESIGVFSFIDGLLFILEEE